MPLTQTVADASSKALGFGSEVGLPRAGLQLFLDATNTASYSGGNTWADVSGNGRNFTWQSAQGGANFNGSGIKYFGTLGRKALGPASNSFGINNTSGYTIIVGMYQNQALSTGAFTFLGGDGSNAATSQARGIFAHMTWGDSNIYFDQGGCCDDTQRVFTAATELTGAWNIVTLTSTVAQRAIWVNTTKKATNNTTAANINLTSAAVHIPSAEYTGQPNGGADWDARLAFFLAYNRGLSDTEVVSAYNALKSKIGLT